MPLKEFEVTSNAIRFTNWLRDTGKDDVKELPDKRRSSSNVSSPIVSGTLPDMFAEDMSNKLSRVNPPMDSGIEPPMNPFSSTAVSFSEFTSPDTQVTPDHPHTSLSGKPDEQDQPDSATEPILVELTISHMLVSCML